MVVLFLGIPLIFVGQANKAGLMPQYLYKEFSNCTVRMKNGQIQTTMMNYNIVSERMVYSKDGKLFDLMNTEIVDTVFIQDRKFIPFGKTFFVLLSEGIIPLFVQYKGHLVKAGKQVGFGGTSELAATNNLSSIKQSTGYYNLEIPVDFSVNPSVVFWIRKDNQMSDFESERQFLKLFPDKSDLIKQFIKKNKLKVDKQEDLIRILNYCGTLN